MDWVAFVRSRLSLPRVRAEREREIVDELAAQLEATYDRALASGLSPQEAFDRATREVPDWATLTDTLQRIEKPAPPTLERAQTNAGPLSGVAGDLRHGLRVLMAAPAFTTAAILTLALGIGATTIIYSLVDGILLRPLPVTEPDRVILTRSLSRAGDELPLSWPDYRDLKARCTSFEALAVWRGAISNFTGRGEPRRVMVRQVSWNLLRVLGVPVVAGRDFVEADDAYGVERTGLISHAFWQREFGGGPDAVGSRLMLDEEPVTIVGVMPDGFAIARQEDVYMPLGTFVAPRGYMMFRGNHSGLAAIGRLAPGVSVAAARAEVSLIAEQLAAEYPDTNAGQGATLTPLMDVLVRDARPTLTALLAAVAVMLLIACVNTANLLLVRGAGRAQEMEVRLALGATRGRIVRQLLAESLLLAAAGGVGGVLLASAGFDAFVALLPADQPRLHQVVLDARVLGVAAAVSLVTGFLFGAVPALQAGSRHAGVLLRSARVSGAGGATLMVRRVLLGAQLAMAVLLLAGGGLMLRTLNNLLGIDPGFDARPLFSASVSLPGGRYSAENVAPFYEQVESRLRASPGVADAAVTLSLPIRPSNWSSVFILEDRPAPPRNDLPSASWTPVSASYFRTMGIRLREGRGFDTADRADTRAVAVVNQRFATRFWPGRSPIGQRVKQGFPDNKAPWVEIVGVVDDVKIDGVDRETAMQVYLPLTQRAMFFGSIVVRAAGGDPAALAGAVETAVHAVDPNLPVYEFQTLEDVIHQSVGRQKLLAVLLAGFAGLALILAAVGVYGVTAYGVAARRHELGIRMALGADRRRLLGQIVAQEMRASLMGLALGTTAALVLAGVLDAVVFGIGPRDPLTLGAVALLLLVVAAAACYLPASRISRLDPATTLRAE